MGYLSIPRWFRYSPSNLHSPPLLSRGRILVLEHRHNNLLHGLALRGHKLVHFVLFHNWIRVTVLH